MSRARFIVIDPNGEYSRSLSDMADTKIFKAEPDLESELQLRVPGWLWNVAEWSAFSDASRVTYEIVVHPGFPIPDLLGRRSRNSMPGGRQGHQADR